MPANIRDIARKLNISVSTVSYALNDGPRPVPEEVKERVRQAARELDYRPNRIARSLSARRSFVVGYVPARPNSDVLLIPYTQHVLNGIMNACEKVGYDFMVFAHHGQMSNDRFVDQLTDGRVDGVVFGGDDVLRPIRDGVARRGVPHVTLSGARDAVDPRLICDNEGGIRLAMEHLYGLGHRRFGCLTASPGIPDIDERFAAVVRFLAARGLELPAQWVGDGRLHVGGGAKASEPILSLAERPTALIALTDEMAIGALRTAYKLGLRVPHDLSVVGFDDFLHAGLVNPNLTTVRQPAAAMAAKAVSYLLELIAGEMVPGVTVFPTELIIRESTDVPKEEPTS